MTAEGGVAAMPDALSQTMTQISQNSRRDTGLNGQIGWGTGNSAARSRIQTLTKGELQRMGVTRTMAEKWRDFYLNEAKRVPNNPSAQGRSEFMQRAVDLLSK